MTAAAAVPYRLLITGSRTWRNVSLIGRVLSGVYREHPDAVLISGHCPDGADADGERWWAVLCGYPDAGTAIDAGRIEIHPADWARYGKRRAGPIRNAEMIKSGVSECVAFIMPCKGGGSCSTPGAHDSHGAGGCYTLAVDAGVSSRPFRAGSRL
jgi:hypothetical protein